MLKAFPILILSLLSWGRGFCQFGNLLNKAKNKINQRIDKKVDQALDKADGTTAKTVSTAAGTGGSDGAAASAPTLTSYSKYDFVPGQLILYAEDFGQDNIGELPMGWNSSGSGEVITLDKYPGRWLRLHKSTAYLTANNKTFGSDYTVEFDLILQLKNNGWMYPEMHFDLLASRDQEPTANSLLKDYQQFAAITGSLHPGENNSSRAVLQSYIEAKSYFKSDIASIAALQNWYGKPVHVAIQVQKTRYRCWINDLKAFDVPKAVPTADSMNQLRFEVGSTNYPEESYGVYIGNLRVATGLPDTRHKLIDEGKFTTNGIQFDANSAVIRPESYGVLKEIAAALKENPSVRVRVIGHTSSDGDDAANLELSKKRAAAVKELLSSEWQIDGSRVDTEGKGEQEPIADNKTKEGRVQNRRVEFIKQ